jgi:dihydroorotate dehydrogenase electron transfer subunit
MDIPHTFFYACGPLPMLRAVCEKSPVSGQISLDARMGCGFGACMGCTIQTARGPRRVCKDGPVFEKEELLWTD